MLAISSALSTVIFYWIICFMSGSDLLVFAKTTEKNKAVVHNEMPIQNNWRGYLSGKHLYNFCMVAAYKLSAPYIMCHTCNFNQLKNLLKARTLIDPMISRVYLTALLMSHWSHSRTKTITFLFIFSVSVVLCACWRWRDALSILIMTVIMSNEREHHGRTLRN